MKENCYFQEKLKCLRNLQPTFQTRALLAIDPFWQIQFVVYHIDVEKNAFTEGK